MDTVTEHVCGTETQTLDREYTLCPLFKKKEERKEIHSVHLSLEDDKLDLEIKRKAKSKKK